MSRYVFFCVSMLGLVLAQRLAHAQQPANVATPADAITVPPGFKVELLHSATEREGSWASMTIDEKGRLYISPQEPAPDGRIVRVTIDEKGQVKAMDWLKPEVGASMGMLWAFDSLYVNGDGPDGHGIYRLRDTDGDDSLDKAELFKAVPDNRAEHGGHALVVGPDNLLYIAHGNSTPLIDGIAPDSPYRNYDEDFLLPRILDPVATFFDKLKVPYGYILRTDPDGKKWELFAGGFRNQYDIDFNADGELFTFDSDMEWDIGLPWYKPTRVLHVTSGAEFGFREGSTKWPEYYPDSLPAVVDIGLSSPTGVKFGTKSNFPEPYKSAFFALDWTYGRVLAVHLTPKGASYTADNPLPNPYYLSAADSSEDVEEFLIGKGMPVTDLEFGPDGAMYLIVGGRSAQSGLYRVSYVGSEAGKTELRRSPPERAAQARAIRRGLEVFHGKRDPKAVEAAWPHLGSKDRFIRYAARIALESQPVKQWRGRALKEKDPRAAMTALLGLVRVGEKETQEPILKRLGAFPLDSLPQDLKLEKLRVIQLSFIRHGRPSDDLVKVAIKKLSKQYPAESFAMNRELSQMLVWLGAPDVVEKTLALMESSQDPAEQIWYAYTLREARQWTDAQLQDYFQWFNKAAGYKGGNSFGKFILAIRDQALETLSEAQREQVTSILTAKPQAAAAGPVVQREFQKEWKMEDLVPHLDKVGSGRDFERGKEIFSTLQCLACHRFGNDGGGTGPDITAVSNRFNRHDLLLSIIEPSKAISEQYASYVITTKDGKRRMGQIVIDNNDVVVVLTDPVTGATERIGRHKVTERRMSPVSIMPSNLLDVLTVEEVMDLLAYIESAGNPDAPHFKEAGTDRQ